MNKNDTSRKKARRIHAKKRCLQRYGFDCNHAIRREIINAIQWKESAWVVVRSKKLTNTKTKFMLSGDDGKLVKVIYDKESHEIVTFLPMEEANA